MKLITAESLHRPEVVRWHKRMIERYTPPDGIKLTVLLPCSAKKPYSASKSHMFFRKYIKKGAGKKMNLVHELILTSPLGVVPREIEDIYPAAHYDVPVTGHWSREEKDIVVTLLSDYIKKAKTGIIAHVDGAYREICGELGLPMTSGDVLSTASLKELEEKISKALEAYQPVKINRRREAMKKICDFQFGTGSAEYLIPDNAAVRGLGIFLGNEQVATIDPRNGLLALTLKGGEMLKKFGKNLVEISFKPESDNIFCPGVEDADEGIRPNDEVIVIYKKDIVGVGRAVLNGEEMASAEKGLALKLRHRK